MSMKTCRLFALTVYLGFTALLILRPTMSGLPMSRDSNMGTQAALKDITLGIKNYQVEYNRYPMPTDSLTDHRLESTGRLLDILLGRNVDGLNPREIVYIEPPMFAEGRGGLIVGIGTESNRLVDRWDHPYVIWIDGNYDDHIANPDVKNTSSLVSQNAPVQLVMGVLAYSLGPDGIEGSEDDIVSWRGPVVSKAPGGMPVLAVFSMPASRPP